MFELNSFSLRNVAENFALRSQNRYRHITLTIYNLRAMRSRRFPPSLCFSLLLEKIRKAAVSGKISESKGSRVVGGREGVNPFASRWNTAFTLELCTHAHDWNPPRSNTLAVRVIAALSSRKLRRGAGFSLGVASDAGNSHSHSAAKVFIRKTRREPRCAQLTVWWHAVIFIVRLSEIRLRKHWMLLITLKLNCSLRTEKTILLKYLKIYARFLYTSQ